MAHKHRYIRGLDIFLLHVVVQPHAPVSGRNRESRDRGLATLPQVVIYTDGACEPNPGPGGWAALLRFGGRERILSGRHPETINNRMELTAAIQALAALTRPCQVDFYTDSEYLKRGITEWLPRWHARGWRRKGGALANADLWQALAEALKQHQVDWHWVRSHAGNPGNQKVDRLARQARCKA